MAYVLGPPLRIGPSASLIPGNLSLVSGECSSYEKHADRGEEIFKMVVIHKRYAISDVFSFHTIQRLSHMKFGGEEPRSYLTEVIPEFATHPPPPPKGD